MRISGNGTKARRLIDGASFEPEALRAIGASFDAAWAESNNSGDDPVAVEKARLRLFAWQTPCQLPTRTVVTSRF
jgi:hypothetical protein